VSAWSAIAIVAVVAVMTYSMRAVAVVALANRAIPTWADRALRSVGPAVLAALTVNLAAGGEGGPNLDVAEALALAVAGGLALWKRNLLVSLGAGMVTLWVVSALV
jgi:branched chain amino acid efflux pump